ncbi:DUF1624 domain-containing protein [Stutzerimonas stutzeri]|uniref:DUF1624 domain-containing protein n=2 Tax=Stutzerimonas stutzeri TaxID=316 RepID=A0A6I6LSG5_STUST|nr:DUF1624 domain-containing protein [Stutzerimonas stutzeri]
MANAAATMPPAGTISSLHVQTQIRTRMLAIDALRGLVMLFMLVDHVRETFFLHVQVGDPMDPVNTPPELFFTRISSMVCAPVFVFLTGLSAWLYGQSHSRREVSTFLLKRGLFLVFLELTLVNFAWNATFIPPTLWLQVIWAIGLSMIVLSALIHMPRAALAVLGLVIVAGHNLLDGITLTADSPYFEIWSILHQRAFLEITEHTRARTTYPILPWIGLIALGYCAGPWFAREADPAQRTRRLLIAGIGLLVGFALIRYLNVYGDKPWSHMENGVRTFMSFMSLTKYPPSLMFLIPTIGVGFLLLAWFQQLEGRPVLKVLSLYGGAPMFFYVLHLLLLKALYLIAVQTWGLNQGDYYGFDSLAGIWLWAAMLSVALYFPTRWFAQLKQRRRDIAWLKYF